MRINIPIKNSFSFIAILIFISAIQSLLGYAFLSNFTFDFDYSARYSKVFIDMWQHLLAGSVEVDVGNIAGEGFLVNGKVIAYFLPFPSLVRGVLSLIGLGNSAVVSMLLATLFINLTTCLIYRIIGTYFLNINSINMYLFIPSVIFPYSFLFFEASVFWESILWSLAIFNLFILGVMLNIKYDAVFYKIILGILSISIVYTRPTYLVSATLILLLLALYDIKSKRIYNNIIFIYIPFILALIFLSMLNYYRWGNIFEFSPMEFHDQFINNPSRILKYFEISSFSLERVPTAFRYYFGFGFNNFQTQFPFFIMDMPFSMHETPRYDYIEKRLSFLLTFPLLIIFSIYGIFKAFNSCRSLFILVLFTFIPFFLVCCIFSLTLRYRSELLPFLVITASIGYIYFSSRLRFCNAVFISIMFNFITLIFSLNSVLQERANFFQGCFSVNPEFICKFFNLI